MPDSLRMAEDPGRRLAASVRAMFASLARYLGLVTRDHPYESADALLARPDVEAFLLDTLASAASAAQSAVQQAWEDLGAPESPLLAHLVSDAARPYRAPHLRRLVRHAHASVPVQHREPGRSSGDPVAGSAAERAQAVRNAVEKFAREAALRNRLSVDAAAGAARTEAALEKGRAWQDEGYEVYKEWVARHDGRDPDSCHWCRKLHGIVIRLDEDFAQFLGPAVDLAGHGHLTQPPKPYRGWLPGPGLHPFCGCKLRITRRGHEGAGDGPPGVQSASGLQEGAGQLRSPASSRAPGLLLSAAAIRAMPEARYQALIAFLRAAVHELAQAVRRLGQA